MADKLWLVDVTAFGTVRRYEEFGATIDEARERAATRHNVPIAKVASVLGSDGQYVCREELGPERLHDLDHDPTLDMPDGAAEGED